MITVPADIAGSVLFPTGSLKTRKQRHACAMARAQLRAVKDRTVET